jgi:hypothetical protein
MAYASIGPCFIICSATILAFGALTETSYPIWFADTSRFIMRLNLSALVLKETSNGLRFSRRAASAASEAVGWERLLGGNPAIDASLELQTPYSTKDTKNIPAVFPLFKPALINRVMRRIWIPRTYSAVFV